MEPRHSDIPRASGVGRRRFLGGTGTLVGLALTGAFLPPSSAAALAQERTTARWRPLLHFTPERNWINDPNGLVFFRGEYHLFFQHNPEGLDHANMSWGHAVSNDLTRWEELPVALEPDELGEIFSGGAVVDHDDTSGFFGGGAGLVAFYTSAGEEQHQSVAYSADRGRSWTKYEGNPVIPNPGIPDFRDPKVIRHDPSGAWVLMLAAGDRIMFYRSSNLRDWEHVSDFGSEHGAHGGVWECPELFELPVDSDPDTTRWVLVVSINPGGPAGGSAVQYFTGDFDGTAFTSDGPPQRVLWADEGSDFYAAQSWSDVPDRDGRRLWVAWMSNWNYAGDVPTTPWRGAMTLPRQLGLTGTGAGYRLTQRPVDELERRRTVRRRWHGTVEEGRNERITRGTALDIDVVFRLQSALSFGVEVLAGANCRTRVGYRPDREEMFLDRTAHGRAEVEPAFPAVHTMSLRPEGDVVRMRIVVDRSCVEAFGGSGEAVLSDLVFPDEDGEQVRLFAEEGEVRVESLCVHELD
ncbi:fructan beta-fructosidase [Haloactinospora alba]|uniref:Fructan beta-fructosidase n=1 Tax=Haloactinospora alba TaxID=405555 RepID=A0A543NKD1_9ACTN|nr:glycoside hydrolase family 32 protein [Haloactinospora alba]TQN32254.1 fructan beta-fructosidase [Haloactinospora alba]